MRASVNVTERDSKATTAIRRVIRRVVQSLSSAARLCEATQERCPEERRLGTVMRSTHSTKTASRGVSPAQAGSCIVPLHGLGLASAMHMLPVLRFLPGQQPCGRAWMRLLHAMASTQEAYWGGVAAAWSYVHIWLGRAAITLGIINGGLGLQWADSMNMSSRGGIIAYAVIAAIVWWVWVVAIVIGERRRTGSQADAPPKYEGGSRRGPRSSNRTRSDDTESSDDIPPPDSRVHGHYAPKNQ